MKTPACPRCQSLYSVKITLEHDGRPGKHPLLLRCGHTFCETCLRKCRQTDDSVQCPTCQVPTKVDVGTDLCRFLSPDLYTLGLIWNKRRDLQIQSQKLLGSNVRRSKKTADRGSPTPKTGAACSECHINNASCQCIKCDVIFCRPCFDRVHQTSSGLKKHHPVPLFISETGERKQTCLSKVPKKTISLHCETHEQSSIEYFCKTDKQAICSHCVIVGDHKDHDVQTMEDKNKEYFSEMEPLILAAQETVWRIEQSEKVLKAALPSARTDMQGVVEEVQAHFQQLHSFLQARQEQIIDDIKAAAQDAQKPREEMESYLLKEKMKLGEALIDAAHFEQSHSCQLLEADLVLERLRNAQDVLCVVTRKEDLISSHIKFSAPTSLKSAIEAYGSVSSANISQMLSLDKPGPDSEKPPVEELCVYSVSDLDTVSPTTDTGSVADSVSVPGDKVESDLAEETADGNINLETTAFPPAKHLNVGHCENIQVTHITTPRQFYVQLSSRQKCLSVMQQQINQLCRKPQSRRDMPDYVDTGDLVLAQFSEDRQWYRARVEDVIEPNDENHKDVYYKVFFADYGNSELVTLHKMRKMKKKFETQPVFAYECSLCDIRPFDEKEEWTAESVNAMLQIITTGSVFMVVVNRGKGALEVDLGIHETVSAFGSEQALSVKDCLVFLELASHSTGSPSHSEVSARYFSPRRRGIKRKFLTVPHVMEGTVANIGINCIKSPSLFYAQMCSTEAHHYLQQMLVSMQETYEDESRHVYSIICPTVGMICAARYAKDNKWYRAQVSKLPGKRKVEVQFVDYGNTETVDCSDISRIPDDYIKYPMQALECSLADVEPLENGQWSDEAQSWFRSVAELQVCQLKVTVHSKEPNTLKGVLYCINSDTNRLCCINYELVSRGFAKSSGPWSSELSFSGITLTPGSKDFILSPSTSAELELAFLMSRSFHLGSSFPQPSSKSHSHPSTESLKTHITSPTNRPQSQLKDTDLPSLCRKTETVQGSVMNSSQLLKLEESTEEGGVKGLNKPGEGCVEVVVCCYQSPSLFYLQLENKQTELQSLMTDLMSYDKLPPSEHGWQAGEFCVAKSTHSDCWYRSRIEKLASAGLFEVKLVDTGHVDVVPASRLQPLKKVHAKVECLAEQCHLASLVPAGTTDSTKWSKTAIEFVMNQISGKRLFLKVEEDAVPDLGLPIDIHIEEVTPETAFDPPSFKYISLISLILDKGLAIPLRRKENTAHPSPQIPVARADPFHATVVPTIENSSSLWPECTDRQQEKEEAAVMKEESCEDKQEIEDTLIVQSDLVVIPHPLPTAADAVSVLPVFVDSKGIVYAQDAGEGEDIAQLAQEVDAYVNNEASLDLLKVTVGQLCLAQFSSDGLWYRARVIEIAQNSVKVKFIDYGNEDEVEKSKLKPISSQLCARPQMLYEFRLHSVQPNTVDGSWPASFREFMFECVVNQLCTAKIKVFPDECQDRRIEVDLFVSTLGSVAAALVENGILTAENDMADFYQRSEDIGKALSEHNPCKNSVTLGNKGDFVHGLITHMDLPNVICIQRTAASPDEELPEDMRCFKEMMDELTCLSSELPELDSLPEAGEVCSAQFTADDRWYRGLVVKACPTANAVLVYYVDYGNSEDVPLSRLRKLPEKFQSIPSQAVRALLDVTLPHGTEHWTLSTYQAMADVIYLQRHVVKILETEPLLVELLLRDEQEENVYHFSYQQLIRDGLVDIPPLMFIKSDKADVISESESEIDDCVQTVEQE